MAEVIKRYFKEIDTQASSMTAFFVSMEESIPSVSVPVYPASGQGSNNPPRMTYYCVVPEEILSKNNGYQWIVSFVTSGNETVLTDIYTVEKEKAGLDIEVMRRLKEVDFQLDIIKSLIDGFAYPSEDNPENKSVIVNKDGIIIQRLTVENSTRVPEFKGVPINYVDGEPELAVVAIQTEDGWVEELDTSETAELTASGGK